MLKVELRDKEFVLGFYERVLEQGADDFISEEGINEIKELRKSGMELEEILTSIVEKSVNEDLATTSMTEEEYVETQKEIIRQGIEMFEEMFKERSKCNLEQKFEMSDMIRVGLSFELKMI